MAAFLSGLMASLKGLGADLGEGLGTDKPGGPGLMSAIDPALAGAPGGAARAPGSGGLMSTEGQIPSMPRFGIPEEGPAKRPGFLSRINTVDPATGMSTVDKFDKFGGRLRDIYGDSDGTAGEDVDKRAAGRVSKARQAALSAQIDQLFPDDAQMRFALKTNPEKATEALAAVYQKRHEPANVGAGDTRVWGEGSTYTAPKFGIDGGFAYGVDDDGFRWGPQRGANHQEAETGRHNQAGEVIDRGQLGVAQGNLGVSRGNLGLSRERFNFDKYKDGRDGADGSGGGGGGLGSMSTEQLIAALRGAR